MKIVFLTPNFPPTICGVGDHTHRLALEMMEKGIEIHVICSANQTFASSDSPLLTVHPVVKAWNTEGVNSIINVVKMIQPDWFVTQYVPHSYHPKGLSYILLFLYRQLNQSKTPILTIFHEVKIRPERAIKTRLMSYLQGIIANKLSNMSVRVVTSIDFYDNNLKDIPSEKRAVIPIGSNILPINVSDFEKQSLRNKYQITANAKIICTFGNRDISSFLPIFDSLSTDYPNLIWLICGKNNTPSVIWPSRSYLRYVGPMSADDIYRHLSLGDVFFLPDYLSENGEGGTCNKSGSLACGLSLNIPIIGTKGDMNNQLLRDKENIILVDINDKNAVVNAFKSCFDSPSFSQKLGNNARDLYDKQLIWKELARRFLEVMNFKQYHGLQSVNVKTITD
jgi:glycosyltransferase involved in cell wall biosynthesis